jgi:Protein of unknown function DUF104
MAKVVTAEYDAEQQTLKPLEGIEDHTKVTVVVNELDRNPPLKDLSGILSDEAGESLARAVEEMFPIEK